MPQFYSFFLRLVLVLSHRTSSWLADDENVNHQTSRLITYALVFVLRLFFLLVLSRVSTWFIHSFSTEFIFHYFIAHAITISHQLGGPAKCVDRFHAQIILFNFTISSIYGNWFVSLKTNAYQLMSSIELIRFSNEEKLYLKSKTGFLFSLVSLKMQMENENTLYCCRNTTITAHRITQFSIFFSLLFGRIVHLITQQWMMRRNCKHNGFKCIFALFFFFFVYFYCITAVRATLSRFYLMRRHFQSFS